uniref:Glutamine amidotransferase-like class 1 domain-containing protein 1 n=11 Tax=Passeriformes TaxID=9126 RepID=A0A8C3M4B2_GEOPR
MSVADGTRHYGILGTPQGFQSSRRRQRPLSASRAFPPPAGFRALSPPLRAPRTAHARPHEAPPLPSGPGPAMSERLAKPSCLIVASAATAGVSAQSFLHCFTLASSAFNLQVATPGGKPIDFVDVNEGNTRWIQDFRMKSYASPAKLESIDGARYHALLIPNCPGAVTDLANSGYLAKILQHFSTESKPICAVGQGVAALCCATNEDKSWVFQGYSLTGPSVYELVRQPNFASLSIIVEDFVKDSGATFSASSPDAVHVVLDRHLVTGQNENSTLPAVQNLLILCNVSRK